MDVLGMGVFNGIGERFLNDPKKSNFHVLAQPSRQVSHMKMDLLPQAFKRIC
jgi:hypothetical protein